MTQHRLEREVETTELFATVAQNFDDEFVGITLGNEAVEDIVEEFDDGGGALLGAGELVLVVDEGRIETVVENLVGTFKEVAGREEVAEV